MHPMQLYRASDALMAHRAAIEQHLFQQAMDLFTLAGMLAALDTPQERLTALPETGDFVV